MFDIGMDGNKRPTRIVDCKNVHSVGNIRASKNTRAVNIASIPPCVSKRLHLVCLTSDGCRLYYTTNREGFIDSLEEGVDGPEISGQSNHPSTLRMLHKDPCPMNLEARLSCGQR